MRHYERLYREGREWGTAPIYQKGEWWSFLRPFFKRALGRAERVVDVMSGTGLFFLQMVEGLDWQGEVVVNDLSRIAVKLASSRIARLGYRVREWWGDAVDGCPCKTDVILLRFGSTEVGVARKEALFQSLANVLRPGGWLFLVDMHLPPTTTKPFSNREMEVVAYYVNKLHNLKHILAGDKGSERYIEKSHLYFQRLRELGFRVRRHSLYSPILPSRHWAHQLGQRGLERMQAFLRTLPPLVKDYLNLREGWLHFPVVAVAAQKKA